MRFIADLIGFSGCKVKLYSRNGIYFVRKISKDFDYNERLKEQMNKQKYFFENMSSGNITVPKILGYGLMDGLFFFDMEYVQGTSLTDYISDADTGELLDISRNLHFSIDLMKKSIKEYTIGDFSVIMEKKINEIQNKVQEKVDQNLLEELRKLIRNSEIGEIKQTFCHGDFTTENIIFDARTRKYYLIDLLDSFVDHYWVDITKLFQDIEGRWYHFRNPKINLNNVTPKMNFINNFLRKNFLHEEQTYNKHHNLFLAVNFSRILPYAENKDRDYITKTIKDNIEKHKILNK